MQFLPILLFTIYYLLFTTPAFAREIPPQPIDTSFGSGPSWGEDIKIERKVEKFEVFDLLGNSLGFRWKIEPFKNIQVGPKEPNFEFPDLLPYLNFTTRPLQKLLPQSLLTKLSLPSNTLGGAIFHPVCDVTSPEGRLTEVKTRSEGKSVFQTTPKTTPIETPPFWTLLLGATKILQSIGIPGFSSWVNLTAPQPVLPGEEENKQMAFCPQPQGPESTFHISVPSLGYTTITGLNWRQAIIDFFDPLWPDGGETTVTVIVKPKKFLPGEETFKKQTSKEDSGFLRSFCPDELCPPSDNEQEPGEYRVGEETRIIKHEFKGVCGARRGYTLLQKSLYPQSLQHLVDTTLSEPCEP